MKTRMYVTMEIVIDHKKKVDPEEVINRCTFAFDSLTEGAEITDVELVCYEEV